MASTVRALTLGSHKYSVRDPNDIPWDYPGELAVGLCDWGNLRLYIPNTPQNVQELDTVIHEMLHAIYPDMSEEEVTEGAQDLTRGLRRLGVLKHYRE